MKKLFIMTLLALLLLQASTVLADPPYLQAVSQREALWLYGLQQPSGAIVMCRDKTVNVNGKNYYRIDPYYANIAALGLLADASPASITVAKNWISWYLTHINANKDINGITGSIYNYVADTESGAELSVGKYEATAAPAASFLLLLHTYANISDDHSILKNNKSAIESIATAMLAAVQKDGFTTAKPGNTVKPLMDNCELYSGLNSAAFLESRIFYDYSKARFFNKQKADLQNNIQSRFWNKNNQNYDVALGQPASWSKFYPDCIAQMYPQLCHVIDPGGTTAQNLYGQVNLSFPNWSSQLNDVFSCALLAYCAAQNNDKASLTTYMTSVRNKYITASNPLPWFNAAAGFTILAAATARQNYQQQTSEQNDALAAGAFMVGADFFAFGPGRWY